MVDPIEGAPEVGEHRPDLVHAIHRAGTHTMQSSAIRLTIASPAVLDRDADEAVHALMDHDRRTADILERACATD